MPVIITPREEWKALLPKSWEPQRLPVKHVIFFPETGTSVCKTKKRCIWRMRRIQSQHMKDRGLPDIKFNFLMGLDGRIYEGTGWYMRAHDTPTSEYKDLDHFISISYIGDFATWVLPEKGVETVNTFIDWSMRKDYINIEWYETAQPDCEKPVFKKIGYRFIVEEKEQMASEPSIFI